MRREQEDRAAEHAARKLRTVYSMFLDATKECLDRGFEPEDIAAMINAEPEAVRSLIRKWWPRRKV